MGGALVSKGTVSSRRIQGVPISTSIVLVGTSFRTSSIGLRERVLGLLLENDRIEIPPAGMHILESILLVTCNRIELYVATDDPEGCTESILSEMQKAEGGKEDLYVKKDLDAIGHIFTVASGLDSLVVGEEQIIQ